MSTATVELPEMTELLELDAAEEMRLRAWARRNYAPATERQHDWHPIVLDEMTRKDHED